MKVELLKELLYLRRPYVEIEVDLKNVRELIDAEAAVAVAIKMPEHLHRGPAHVCFADTPACKPCVHVLQQLVDRHAVVIGRLVLWRGEYVHQHCAICNFV